MTSPRTTLGPTGGSVLRTDDAFLAQIVEEETPRHRAYRFTIAVTRLAIAKIQEMLEAGFDDALLDRVPDIGIEQQIGFFVKRLAQGGKPRHLADLVCSDGRQITLALIRILCPIRPSEASALRLAAIKRIYGWLTVIARLQSGLTI